MGAVAAINGASPAGGCMLAMSCDYRVMNNGPKTQIGLNETKLGIVAPEWLMRLFVNTIGQKNAELHLKLGSMLSAQNALDIGLVDEVVAQAEVMPRALAKLKEFKSIPGSALMMTKQNLRKELISGLRNNLDKDVDEFVGFVMMPPVQKALDAYISMLAARSKKSKM